LQAFEILVVCSVMAKVSANKERWGKVRMELPPPRSGRFLAEMAE